MLVLTEDFPDFSKCFQAIAAKVTQFAGHALPTTAATFFLIHYSLTTEDKVKRLLCIRYDPPALTLTISAPFQMRVYMVTIILILNNYFTKEHQPYGVCKEGAVFR